MMTLNCWGLASIPKKISVCRLFEDQFIDILFLQETMGYGALFVGELESMIKGWKFVFVDVIGNYVGLLLDWRIHNFQFINAWAVGLGLCVSLYSIELKMDLCFVNLYGPYVDREGSGKTFLLWMV